jgi:hypothetical protein
MSRKIDDLFGVDEKARWNIVFVSMVVTFITILVFLIGGVSLQIVQIVAVIVGATAYFSQMAVYKFSPRIKWRKSDRVTIGGLFTPFVTLSATTLIAFIMLIASPNIQASVLNRRLRAILETPPSTKRSAETRRILKYATQTKVKLLPALVSKAVTETEDHNDPESWEAYLSAATLQESPRNLEFIDISNASSDFYPLDGNEFKDSSLSGLKFAYRGGRVKFDNTHFDHAKFAVADNENGRKFVGALMGSHNGTISITLGHPSPD